MSYPEPYLAAERQHLAESMLPRAKSTNNLCILVDALSSKNMVNKLQLHKKIPH